VNVLFDRLAFVLLFDMCPGCIVMGMCCEKKMMTG